MITKRYHRMRTNRLTRCLSKLKMLWGMKTGIQRVLHSIESYTAQRHTSEVVGSYNSGSICPVTQNLSDIEFYESIFGCCGCVQQQQPSRWRRMLEKRRGNAVFSLFRCVCVCVLRKTETKLKLLWWQQHNNVRCCLCGNYTFYADDTDIIKVIIFARRMRRIASCIRDKNKHKTRNTQKRSDKQRNPVEMQPHICLDIENGFVVICTS